MNKLIIALLAPVFGAASASALAEELPKTRSMADICPSKFSRIMVNAPTDLVLRTPEPGLRVSDEARAEAKRAATAMYGVATEVGRGALADMEQDVRLWKS